MNKNLLYLALVLLILSCKDGGVGPRGLNSLILTSSEPAGANCEYGGLKIESGIDNNSNGTLDPDEVTKTDYVCGAAGNNSLVNIVDEPVGINCSNGGVKIESGIDENRDGTLGADEVEVTRYVCNGTDGRLDEQIRLTLIDKGNSGVFTNSTTGRIFGDLINFDKTFWNEVDSIVFVPNVYGDAGTGIVELYDDTNDVVINNSSLVTQSDLLCCIGETLMSPNLFNDLPESPIDLRIQIRVTDGTKSIGLAGKSYLFLYRSN